MKYDIQERNSANLHYIHADKHRSWTQTHTYAKGKNRAVQNVKSNYESRLDTKMTHKTNYKINDSAFA